jgi:hypothetical protein
MTIKSFMIKSFIDKLSEYNILLLTNLWCEKLNINEFNYNDILYLRNYYYNSKKIEQFFKYYKSLPIDLQDQKYFDSIIFHYKKIYLDYLNKFN